MKTGTDGANRPVPAAARGRSQHLVGHIIPRRVAQVGFGSQVGFSSQRERHPVTLRCCIQALLVMMNTSLGSGLFRRAQRGVFTHIPRLTTLHCHCSHSAASQSGCQMMVPLRGGGILERGGGFWSRAVGGSVRTERLGAPPAVCFKFQQSIFSS